MSFALLDNQPRSGGAWLHGWKSLRLFSPSTWSSLPGRPMPASESGLYPSRDEVLDYFAHYEARYQFPIERPVCVQQVTRSGTHMLTHADSRMWQSRAVVSATGNWSNPYIPDYPGIKEFKGTQRHSALYVDAMNHTGNRGGCLVKVKQVPQLVLQVVDSNALRLRLAGCRRSIPAGAGG
ncbi:monooxygenase [Alcaligenes faecalis subsp. faecalis NCIB 8687]|nr:monooxygenase [Alcaligenes faecalis subsp. faecalis NCIB 8687]